MLRTQQALVAIGGRASRLRAGGLDVPVSKSFLRVAGEPLLYWCLRSLRQAGIRRLVLAADSDIQLYEAELVLDRFRDTFDRVEHFSDKGYGVHGLPFYALHQLEDTFLFECGHNIATPAHYQRLDDTMAAGKVVFSAFQPHPVNKRYPVTLVNGMIKAAVGDFALAHPFLLDRRYGLELPEHGFDITRVICSYAAKGRLSYVASELPPEFDLKEEFDAAIPVYERYVRSV